MLLKAEHLLEGGRGGSGSDQLHFTCRIVSKYFSELAPIILFDCFLNQVL